MTIVTCSGRIVAGEESKSLQVCLDRLLPDTPHVLLHLGAVDFIDSGGLGLIARYLTRPQDRRGTLKVCAVSPKIDDVLRITRLKSVFQPYADTKPTRSQTSIATVLASIAFDNPDVLCVDESPDVLTYLRELLKEAGYRTLTAANIPDALILLKATRPKIVVIGAELRTADTQASEEFKNVASAGTVVELPAGFSRQDAGEAAQQVLQALRDGGRAS